MTRRASQRGAGFHTNGTRRNVTTGALRAQRGNPWGNPCPQCGAKRYERCFKLSGCTLPDTKERIEFIYIKHETCQERVTWYPYGQQVDMQSDNEGAQ